MVATGVARPTKKPERRRKSTTRRRFPGSHLLGRVGAEAVVGTVPAPAAIYSCQVTPLGECLQVPGSNSLCLVGIRDPREAEHSAVGLDRLARCQGVSQIRKKAHVFPLS